MLCSISAPAPQTSNITRNFAALVASEVVKNKNFAMGAMERGAELNGLAWQENRNRKPSIFPWNISGASCNFPFNQSMDCSSTRICHGFSWQTKPGSWISGRPSIPNHALEVFQPRVSLDPDGQTAPLRMSHSNQWPVASGVIKHGLLENPIVFSS